MLEALAKSRNLEICLFWSQKNQVIWTTRFKVMAKYISIYFTKSWMTLDDHKLDQKEKCFH